MIALNDNTILEYSKISGKTLSLFSLVFLIVFNISCKKETGYLEQALIVAGENRCELEKVLTHYKDDPLKLEAARFLIENMPGHYSYKDTLLINRYYDQLDSVFDLCKNDIARKDSLYDKFGKEYSKKKLEFVADIHVITAAYLIGNIDRAFEAWKQGDWAVHIDFNDFCEYILPYKADEKQSLDNWRVYLSDSCKIELERLNYCSQFIHSSYYACDAVNRKLMNMMRARLTGTTPLTVSRMSTLTRIPSGTCAEYSLLTTAMMRANGIPVVTDFTPHWPFRSLSHSWNVLLENNGRHVAFPGANAPVGELHKKDHKMAKAFRKTYAINRELQQLNFLEKYVPQVFRNIFIKDVTDEYMPVSDLTFQLDNPQDSKYAYLTVFNDEQWVPIYWGKISGKKVEFKAMGRDILYMPVYYGPTGNTPVSEPFVLTLQGEVKPIVPDTFARQTLHLYRKYPVFHETFAVGTRLIGGKFQASANPQFKDAVTIYTVSDFTTETKEFALDSVAKSYRYWRYLSPNDAFCNIAEIVFFEKDTIPVYGKIIGTEGTFRKGQNYTRECVFDRDILTFFDAPEGSGCWVGMDFGKPVDISKIRYSPRSDGNCIEPGDEYELMYWMKDQWVSLGKKKAEGLTISFEDCPVNALFLLHNKTKGWQERPFTYENGRQVWQ